MKCQEVERKIQNHSLVQASQVQLLIFASFKSQVASEIKEAMMELKANLYCFTGLADV